MNQSAQGKKTGLAISSLVLGISSITCFSLFTGIPAIICGHVARSNAKKNPQIDHGSEMALAGLITGYIGTFVMPFVLGILMALMFPAVNSAADAARKAQAKNDVTQVAIALIAYETEYGKFPVATEKTMRVEGELIKTLTGDINSYNPRGIVFLEINMAKKGKSGLQNGVFVDPWGGTYKVIMDANNDNQVTLEASMGSKTLSKKVAVWNDTTEHPDKSEKNSAKRQVKSWE